MGAPADHHSNFASEQSLRRSFSTIHRSPFNGSLPRLSPVSNHGSDESDDSGIDVEVHQDSLLNIDRRGRVIRSRRRSLATTAPSPTSGAFTPPILIDKFPALPFAKDDSPQLQRESSRERPARKFQRRYSPVTVDMAREMVTKLTSQKQHERRHSMMVRVADTNDEPRRRATVTHVPPHHFSSSLENNNRPKRRSSADCVPSHTQTAEQQHKGFRNDYSIGETVRSPSHMIIEPTSDQAMLAVSLLNKHDFAFVKRSDGSYSYAILAYRSMEPNKGSINMSMEECMIFVMCDAGSTKMVRKRHWGQFVRLVSGSPIRSTTKTRTTPTFPPSLDQHLEEHFVELCQEITPPVLCQEIEHGNDRVPPSMIAFVPQMDEECSLISSVSDRARVRSRHQTM